MGSASISHGSRAFPAGYAGSTADANRIMTDGKSENGQFVANNPQENSVEDNSSRSEESGDGRFDIEDPFKDMECTNVYIDEDERERLPDFFNLKNVKHIKRSDCNLCHEPVGGRMTNSRKKMYCSYCGQTVCKYCCQNRRALSKADPKPFAVCDMCDHMLSNMLFKESVKLDIERKKIACEELT